MLKKSELILFAFVLVVVSLWSLLAFGIDKEFRKCAGCHKIEEGKKGGMGPNLWGVFDSKAGQVEGYRYSDYLKNSDIVNDCGFAIGNNPIDMTKALIKLDKISEINIKFTFNFKQLISMMADCQIYQNNDNRRKLPKLNIKKEEDMTTILDYLEKMK